MTVEQGVITFSSVFHVHRSIPIPIRSPKRIMSNVSSFSPRLVYPGDDVTSEVDACVRAGESARLGAGLVARGDAAVACRAGILSHKEPARFFVLGNQRRYYAGIGDTVVGVITDRNAEQYRMQLHGTTLATLPVLAFDGASRRNKPNLAVGALVFGRVCAVSKYMDAELTCQGEVLGRALCCAARSCAATPVAARRYAASPPGSYGARPCFCWRTRINLIAFFFSSCWWRAKRLDDWAECLRGAQGRPHGHSFAGARTPVRSWCECTCRACSRFIVASACRRRHC